MLDALGTAWSTYLLYPNPADQPAFQRALGVLGTFAGSALTLDIGAGSFHFAGKQLSSHRDGAERLATRLFVHDVQSLRMGRAPTGAELSAFFAAVAREETDISDLGGLDLALQFAGVESILVTRRGLLGDRPDVEDGDDEWGWEQPSPDDAGEGVLERTATAMKVAEGAPPEEIAAQLLEVADGDVDLVAKHFSRAFVELYHVDVNVPGATTMQQIAEMLIPYLEEDAPTPPLVTFLDTFLCLPEDAQVAVFSRFLDALDDGVHRLFVDQFSGEELKALAARMGEERAEAVTKYAQSALDRPDAKLDDLLPPLRSAAEVKGLRQAAARNVAAALADGAPLDVEGIGRNIRAELEGDATDLGWRTLARLIGVEYRSHRFKRLLRIWVGRITALLRDGSIDEALRGVCVVEDDPPYQPEQRRDVIEALGKLVTHELLEALTAGSDSPGYATAMEFVSSLGSAAIDHLIEQLASEEHAGRRKMLVELLGSLAERDLRHVIRRLEDPRWYVVRNLATILGRSGRAEALEPVRNLMGHEDYRVRTEALRAIVRIDSSAAGRILIDALDDDNERLRQTALAHLRTGRADVTDLAAAINRGTVDQATVTALVDIIARQETREAGRVLQEMASRKIAVKASDRAARAAARDALKRRGR